MKVKKIIKVLTFPINTMKYPCSQKIIDLKNLKYPKNKSQSKMQIQKKFQNNNKNKKHYKNKKVKQDVNPYCHKNYYKKNKHLRSKNNQ